MSVTLRRTESHHGQRQRERRGEGQRERPRQLPLEVPPRPVRRVRHQARDALAVAAFSAASSVGLAAVAAFLLAWLGRA